jgi:hypothetical protein
MNQKKQVILATILLLSPFYIQGFTLVELLDQAKQIEVHEHENGTELTAVIQAASPEKIIKIHKNRLKPTHAEIFVKHADSEISIDLDHQESERLFNFLMSKRGVRTGYPIVSKKKWETEDILVYLG